MQLLNVKGEDHHVITRATAPEARSQLAPRALRTMRINSLYESVSPSIVTSDTVVPSAEACAQ